MRFRIGSLFDGSGGFPLAASLCGGIPTWASEVEPYPVAVTRSRFPEMRHIGDVSKVNGAEVEPVDVITFGSPCQDLSVAGKRAGLKHEANGDEETTRSGLFMEAVRIIKEMRAASNGVYPTFAVWENVPGAFSSNRGEDFRIVLEELIKIVEPSAVMPPVPKNGWPYADCYCGDGWNLAYRVFDAQYWGVPQRRRRIHLVLDLRGERAGEVLFERQGLRGYFAEGGTQWKGSVAYAEGSSGADDRARECVKQYSAGGGDVAACLYAAYGTKWNGNSGAYSGENFVMEEHTCDGKAVPYTLKIRSGCEGGGKGQLIQTNQSATLLANNDQYLFQPVKACSVGNGKLHQVSMSETCNTLDCMHDQQAVMLEHPDARYVVRRLTPVECARLQGFPDDWATPDHKDDFTGEEYEFWLDVRNTHAAINGKPTKNYTKAQMLSWYNRLHTDSAEYKMWGNGIALPPALYCMQGIAEALGKEFERV